MQSHWNELLSRCFKIHGSHYWVRWELNTYWTSDPNFSNHAQEDLIARRSICSCLGSFTLVARPTTSKPRTTHQVRSSCHHSSPWRAEYSKAWWLLCHPSPKASNATHLKLRLQQMEKMIVSWRAESDVCDENLQASSPRMVSSFPPNLIDDWHTCSSSPSRSIS